MKWQPLGVAAVHGGVENGAEGVRKGSRASGPASAPPAEVRVGLLLVDVSSSRTWGELAHHRRLICSNMLYF